MKKDIYVIKNRINDKLYIGQALNTAERFRCHCKSSSNNGQSIIDAAIVKYGASNFYYEILESQIEDYNEKEKYWIKELNTLVPNGYNILEGGNEPPVHYGIEHQNAAVKDKNILQNIKQDLRETTIPLSKIGEKYGISKRTVIRINQGIHYSELNEEYPIRKNPNPNGKLSPDRVAEIIDILKYTYRQYESIGNEYGVSTNTIKNINAGKNWHFNNEDYPIRKYKNSGKPIFTYEQVTEIIELLKTTNLTYAEIGNKYGVKREAVATIATGLSKRYYRNGEIYPIQRPNK